MYLEASFTKDTFNVRPHSFHDREFSPLLNHLDGDVFDHDVRPELVRTFLENPANHLVVAVTGGEVVGMASGISYVHPLKKEPSPGCVDDDA